MGLFDSVTGKGVAFAEHLERTAGPSVALPVFRSVPESSDPDTRARVILGILRCSIKLGDLLEVSAQAGRWRASRGGVFLDEIIDLCKALVAAGHADVAVDLAEAEIARDPKARAFYLYARCLERAGNPDATMVAFMHAAERAEVEPGAEEVSVAARVRRIERLAASPETLAEAVAEASAADPARGSAAHKLVIAAARLASPSRFTRASALSILEELARKGRPEVAEAAVRLAVQHADAHGGGLSAVEVDRLAALFKHWRDPKERESALARLHALVRIASAKGEEERERALVEASEAAPETFALLCRARAVLAGGGQGSYAPSAGGPSADAQSAQEASPPLRLAGLGLDVVVALRRGKAEEAARALAAAAALLKTSGAAAPPSIWTGLFLALRSPDRAARAGAIELAETLLGFAGPAGSRPLPPAVKGGELAAVLRLAGRADLAARVLRGAAAAKEPGAAADLAMDLLRHGWTLAARGERDAALAALREARALFARARPGDGP